MKSILITKSFSSLFLLLAPLLCESFGDFQIPKFPSWLGLPKPDGTNAMFSNNNSNTRLQPGDTIAVIGASGNVGKLVALRLSDNFKVNGVVRDASSIQPFFEGRKDRISLYEANLLDEMMSK
jgi:Putative NADH-flavin reductase